MKNKIFKSIFLFTHDLHIAKSPQQSTRIQTASLLNQANQKIKVSHRMHQAIYIICIWALLFVAYFGYIKIHAQ